MTLWIFTLRFHIKKKIDIHTYKQTKELTSEKKSCLIKSKKRKKQNKTKQNYTKKRKAKTKQQTEKWKKTENKIKIGINVTSGHLEKKQNKE